MIGPVQDEDAIALALHDEALRDVGRQFAAMTERDRDAARLLLLIGHADALQQHHVQVASALSRRAVERIRELFDFVADTILLERGRNHRQSVLKALPFPGIENAFGDVAEIEPELKVIRVAVIVPDAGAAVNAELGNRAIPR